MGVGGCLMGVRMGVGECTCWLMRVGVSIGVVGCRCISIHVDGRINTPHYARSCSSASMTIDF